MKYIYDYYFEVAGLTQLKNKLFSLGFKIPEDGEDFECPNCHNTIELEMMFDDDQKPPLRFCDGGGNPSLETKLTFCRWACRR